MNASNETPKRHNETTMDQIKLEDFTQTPLSDVGTFRAYPIAWTIEPSDKSQSVAIAIRFAIHQQWHAEQKVWSEEWPIGYYTEGRSWVVGKDGNIGEKAVTALKKAGLWDGDWDKIAEAPPRVFVHLDVELETFEGKPRHRAAWIKPDADEPAARGGFAPANADLLTSLRSRFQSSTRAIAAGKPAGTAPPPPKTTPALGAPAPAATQAAQPQAAQAPTQPAAAPAARPTAARPQPPGAPAQRPAASAGRPLPPAGPRPGPRPTPAIPAGEQTYEAGEPGDEDGPQGTGLEDVPF